MAFFKAKKSKNVEKPTDTVGGSAPLPSGVYDAVLKLAYGAETTGGAQKIVVEFELPELDKRKFTQHLIVVSKEGKNTSETRDGKIKYLPGFLTADAISQIACDMSIIDDDLEVESRTVKIKNENQKADVFVDLLGAKFKLGIISTEKWKQVDAGNGNWVDTDEVMTLPQIHTVFDEDGFTLNEYNAEAPEPLFIEEFLSAWEGKTRKAPAKKEAAPRGSRSSASERGKPVRSQSRREQLR